MGEINQKLLIIAVSALITDSIVEKIKKCGFDDYSTLILLTITYFS